MLTLLRCIRIHSVNLVRPTVRGSTKLTRWIPNLPSNGLTPIRTLASGPESIFQDVYTKLVEAFPDVASKSILGSFGILIVYGFSFGIARVCYTWRDPKKRVRKTFTKPNPPPLIREGDHFPREKEEEEVRNAFLNKTDTLGLVGVVFGPAGTGKSNVVRTVCRTKTFLGDKVRGTKGVVYMEIGSPRQFPHHLAKACGVPIEHHWLDAVISKMFPTLRTYITLPSNDQDALALVLPFIAEGAKAYKAKYETVSVLFIDGVDILAKQEDNKLYVNLVDWAKKCANEDSLRIVLVCSDSHVLALDQQSFKSRLDALIEIGDVDEPQAVEELLMKKYHFPKNLAKSTYDIVAGRLADIHKVVSICRREVVVVPQEIVDATKYIDLSEKQALQEAIHSTLACKIESPVEDKSKEIIPESKRKLICDMIKLYNFDKMNKIDLFRQQFSREMKQAFCKALGNDNHEIKRFVIIEVLEGNGKRTVEEIALKYEKRTEIEQVVTSIKELLRHNVLRITKQRELCCYNKIMEELLMEYRRTCLRHR